MNGRNETAGSQYRYGFQSQEMDDEVKGKGNSVNYKYRMHDPRIGRFFAVDPLAPKYPHNSPYGFSGNHVINSVELEGLEDVVAITQYDNNVDGTFVADQMTMTWSDYNSKFGYLIENPTGGEVGPQGEGTLSMQMDISGDAPTIMFQQFSERTVDVFGLGGTGIPVSEINSVTPAQESTNNDLVISSNPTPADPGAKFAPSTMSVSEEGAAFIASYEVMKLKMYNDAAGHATIGVGHLVHHGKIGTDKTSEAPFVNGITKAQAVALFKKDLEAHSEKTRSLVTVPLTQNQFDALVALEFNIGGGGMGKASVVKKINAGATEAEIRERWLMWITAGGENSVGLYNRRRDELDMFFKGDYNRDYNDTSKTVKWPQ